MKKNESTLDRVIRVFLAVGTGYLAYNMEADIPRVLLGILTIVLLMTAITGFCGLYAILGISTCPMKKTKTKSKTTKKKNK